MVDRREKGLKVLLFNIAEHMGYLNVLLGDCSDALRNLGHNVEVFDLTRYKDSQRKVLKELGTSIDKFHPDFIFLTGADKIILEFLASREIPYGDWIFDDPLLCSLSGFCSSYGLLFVADRVWVERVKVAGVKNVFYLPCAVNPKIYHGVELTKDETEKYSCDVSFVGNSKYSYYKRHYLDELDKRGSSLALTKVLDEAIRVQVENPLLEIPDILEVVQEKYDYSLTFENKTEREFFELGLNFAASSLYRKQIVEELTDFCIRVYGDDGWKEWHNDRIDFRGGITHREELVKLYNACRINIGATLFQLRTALTVRPFQVSACGGFLIDDYRHDLGRLFELGKEMICYRDKKELRELVGYFLKHPEERREIAQRAKARVLKDHTFEQRMEEALRILKESFNL